MKFFWWYVIGFISVLLISSFVVSIRELREDFLAIDGTEGSNNQSLDTAFDKASTTLLDKSFAEYHVSDDILRKSKNLKGMNMIDENGVQVVMDFEPTQVFPVYYTPGSFLYGASAFVPSYEESVKLSQVKPQIEKIIDPLKWSWSNKQGHNNNNNYNYMIKPIDLKPIIKEDIPVTGILSTGYFVLQKSKNYNKFQMGMIPEGYYIYDESNMAQIPPGFQASLDRMYIFRKTDTTQSMIDRSNKYIATDLTPY